MFSSQSQALAHYKGTKHAKKLKALDAPKTKLKGSVATKEPTNQDITKGTGSSQVPTGADGKGLCFRPLLHVLHMFGRGCCSSGRNQCWTLQTYLLGVSVCSWLTHVVDYILCWPVAGCSVIYRCVSIPEPAGLHMLSEYH